MVTGKDLEAVGTPESKHIRFGTLLNETLKDEVTHAIEERGLTFVEFTEQAFRQALACALIDSIPCDTPLVVSHVGENPRAAEAPCVALALDRWSAERVYVLPG